MIISQWFEVRNAETFYRECRLLHADCDGKGVATKGRPAPPHHLATSQCIGPGPGRNRLAPVTACVGRRVMRAVPAFVPLSQSVASHRAGQLYRRRRLWSGVCGPARGGRRPLMDGRLPPQTQRTAPPRRAHRDTRAGKSQGRPDGHTGGQWDLPHA